jgi:hypothetical protein
MTWYLPTGCYPVIAHGEIILDDFLPLRTRKARYDYMVDTGKLAAETTPYFQELIEIHYLQKKTLDLRKVGFGKDEETIVIRGQHLPLDRGGTRLLVPLAQNSDKIGFQSVDPTHIDLGAELTHIHEQLQGFVVSYIHQEKH